MATQIVYTTKVNGTTVYKGDDLETAIRSWDGNATPNTQGDISLQVWDDGYCVRDAYILHVRTGQHVYLNPNVGHGPAGQWPVTR